MFSSDMQGDKIVASSQKMVQVMSFNLETMCYQKGFQGLNLGFLDGGEEGTQMTSTKETNRTDQ